MKRISGFTTLSQVVAAAVAAAVFCAAVGCADGPPAIAPAKGWSMVRLIDHLELAEISSPLTEAAPLEVERIEAELEPSVTVRGRPVLRDSEGCEVADERGTGQTDLQCRDSSVTAFWELPVASGSYTRIRADLMTDNAECFEVTVENGRQDLVYLALDDRPGTWQTVSALVVAAPTARAEGPRLWLRTEEGRSCSVEVGSVVAERFDLTPEQRLGMLKAQSLFDGARDDLGVAKQGVLLPTGDVETVQAPFDHNFSIEEALFLPAPGEISFRVAIPARARLFFSYGPHRGSREGDTVGFEVSVKRRWRERVVLWTDTVPVAEGSWHWRHATVDLGDFGDSTVMLTLRSFAAGSGDGLAVWGTPTIDVPRAPQDPPNVVLIAVDTLRADRLGCYGYPGEVSPHIDALAADGLRFDRSFAQSNWTRPSFASIFSGLSVESHGVVGLLDELPPSVDTLAEKLRRSGWTTHGIAYKPALADRGFEQGFESYFNVPRVHHQGDQNVMKMRAFLERHHDRRFFLFLHFNDPHLPYTHPQPFLSGQSIADLRFFHLERPAFIESDLGNCLLCGSSAAADARYRGMGRRMYVEEVRYLDHCIGEVVDDLRWYGLYDDAIVIFVSDHGESLWDHYDYFGHGGENHHDELVRVPLIVKPPHRSDFARGGVVTADVRAFDLMPTILDLLGLTDGSELEAVSLRALLEDPARRWETQPVISTNDRASAVREWPWRYWRSLLPHDDEERLFNLDEDPAELHDVATDNPETVARLRLAAAEHVLLRHGGRFVVVLGDGTARNVVLSWSAPVRLDPPAHLGLRLLPRDEAGGFRLRGYEFRFAGAGSSRGLDLVAGFVTAEGSRLRVRTGADDEVSFESFPLYNAGRLAELVEDGRPGVWVFQSPAADHRRLSLTPGATHVDPEQLRALRALGYAD